MSETIFIEDIKTKLGVAQSFADMMRDCAVFAFHEHGYSSGLELTLTYENQKLKFNVEWEVEITDSIKASMNDMDRTVEFGAYCFAILFCSKFVTNCKYFWVSKKRTGVDFLLFDKEKVDIKVDAACGRLEVSGINKASSTNNMKTRLKIKNKQTEMSDNLGIPAYISITEFSTTQSSFTQRNGRNSTT